MEYSGGVFAVDFGRDLRIVGAGVKPMEIKTNVMRVLDKHKIPYNHYCYLGTGASSGVEIAAALGQDPAHVFKTLVTVSKSRHFYVFMLPVAQELDLKKAAAAVGEKALDMLPQKELLPLTGYVHGGCSPVGMKKFFTTTIDQTAANFATIIFSAGKVGYQVELAYSALAGIIPCQLADITM